MWTGNDKNVTDVRQGNDRGYEATKNKSSLYKQNSRKGEIRKRLGCIRQKPERLGIEH